MKNYLFFVLLVMGSVVFASEERILKRMSMQHSPTTAPFVEAVSLPAWSKTINFLLWTGSLFDYNPGSHLWLMGDGYIEDGSEPRKSLQGRGIIFGESVHCYGVSFEHFGVNNGFPDPCIPTQFMSHSFYEIELEIVGDEMTVYVDGPELSDQISIQLGTDYQSFNTVMGVANDRNPSTYAVFNLIERIEHAAE